VTVRSSSRGGYVAPRPYTTEGLAEAQRLDDLADAEWEARRPEREAAEAAERARSAAYYARVPAYVPPPVESKLVMLPGLGGLGYEHQGALWRFVVEGATVGPHHTTKRAMLADARRYAVDYGLTVDDAGATGASGNRARVTLSTSASGWRGLSRGRSLAGFDQKELHRGTEVEREHVGGVTSLARRIAADHLTEDPRYYAKLAKMEAHRAGRDRAVPRSARRFAPSREFLVVVRGDRDPSATGAVVAREPSLSRARELAQREADRWGMPADVLDDGWHLVATYAPGSHRAGAPKRLSHDRCANRCGCSPSGAHRSTAIGRRG
jgi:hypothetical protein